jgi:hypothetical protein
MLTKIAAAENIFLLSLKKCGQWCFSSFFMLYPQASMAMVWQCLLSRAFGEV